MFRILAADNATYDFARSGATKHQMAVFADRFHGGAAFHGIEFGGELGGGVGAGGEATEGAPGNPVNGASACKR
ncbi:hypothetical protein A3B61_01390 [Candidatus Peribacteria bacterium RIFCSPLOWO2_01_FULL_53_10]|nr:MAG: hypothetical protein A3B61_01390 [Candidatus Peribacteria bacterium RIFCSPLOWO2_01_FULL_53_10]